MDKVYNPVEVEEKIYKTWEKAGYFSPKIDKDKKPFTIILPPPNANAPLHFGHAMYVIEDILIRYHRMRGNPTLWLPGADHAGFETQFVFEKKLQKQDKSRLDFSKETLYEMIWDFVQKNQGGMEEQLRRLGFSLDWTRKKFTLDADIVKIVYQTFKKMYGDGLIYRGERLVNYCTRCGTSFSDLEVNHREQKDPLYYLKYGPFVLATVRPETKFGDTAVAVNPKDKRYQKYIGKEIEFETLLGKRKMKVIADAVIDPEFGTGVAKVTPAHDMKDFEMGMRHNLEVIPVIGFDGKLNDKAGKYKGLYVKQARKIVAQDLQEKGLMEKIDENYTHVIEVCYKCGTTIEPMLLPQWFIKMEVLAKPAIEAVKKGKIKIFPKRFEKPYFQFLKNIHDWNISRQIVWGIRIPAWFREWAPSKSLQVMGFHERTQLQVLSGKTKTYRLRDHGFKVGNRFALENSQSKTILGYGTIINIEETKVGETPLNDKAHGATYKNRKELIKAFKFHKPGLVITEKTKVWIYTYSFGVLKDGRVQEIYVGEEKPSGDGWVQDEDTFDTWFSSAQWPFATLMSSSNLKLKTQNSKLGKTISDYDYFYPTTVMETGYDILPWWVARMVMVGLYVTGKPPFENVVLHGLVKDPLGKKMSKSKGNVVEPLEIIGQYGADAVRMALVFGTALGNDQSLSYAKLQAMRNFSNKLWNIGRFIKINKVKSSKLKVQSYSLVELAKLAKEKNDKEMIKKTQKLVGEVTRSLDNYNFNRAGEMLYNFIWHEFADKYIEDVKRRATGDSYLIPATLYMILLKLLHPFMPFITEELYQKLGGAEKSIMVDEFPQI